MTSTALLLRRCGALSCACLLLLSCGKGAAPPELAPPPAGPLGVERRLVRRAELTLETEAPAAARARLSAVAEQRGGFVVSSQLTRRLEASGDDDTEAQLVLRVPAAAFAATLEALRGGDVRVLDERESGEDVTEEYVDLEARLRAARALEAQLLSFLKETHSVKDALEVHERLAAVRAELERAEGRRRFLEDQAALATITVRVVATPPVVSRGRFDLWAAARLAGRDAQALTAALVTGAIRLLGVLVPLLALVAAPLWAVRRLLRRRRPLRSP